MTKSKRIVLIVLPLLLLVGAAAFLLGYNQEGFTGSRVKNPDSYLLDIEKMNGTDLHTLELCEGDVLQIQFETEKQLVFYMLWRTHLKVIRQITKLRDFSNMLYHLLRDSGGKIMWKMWIILINPHLTGFQ